MIKLKVVNMSCGHCRLKITSVLTNNEYKIESIDMDEQSILLNEGLEDFKKIRDLLDEIGYIITVDKRFLELKEIVYWNTLLEDDYIFNQTLIFIKDKGYHFTEFSDSPFGLKILAVDSFIDELEEYVTHL